MHSRNSMLIAVAFLLAAPCASALTGTEFLVKCDNVSQPREAETVQQSVDRALNAGSCIGIVGGLIQGVNLVGNMLKAQGAADRLFICLPEGVQAVDLLDLVLADLRGGPADAGAPASLHIYRTIMSRYPCAAPESAAPAAD